MIDSGKVSGQEHAWHQSPVWVLELLVTVCWPSQAQIHMPGSKLPGTEIRIRGQSWGHTSEQGSSGELLWSGTEWLRQAGVEGPPLLLLQTVDCPVAWRGHVTQLRDLPVGLLGHGAKAH